MKVQGLPHLLQSGKKATTSMGDFKSKSPQISVFDERGSRSTSSWSKAFSSLLRSRFLDVTQRSPPLGGALRDIQKTAAKET